MLIANLQESSQAHSDFNLSSEHDHLKPEFNEPHFRLVRRLHQSAMDIVDNIKIQESRLIDILQEIDQHKVYRAIGYQSLYRYAVDALRLSEHAAYNYITVARKSVELPQLKQAIANQELTVSKARKICAVITEENQLQWIEMAKELPKEKLEQEVAKLAPRSLVPEQTRFITDTILEMSLPIGEEAFKKLKRVQDLLCQSEKKSLNLEQTIERLSEFYLNRKDPVQKAKRAAERSAKETNNPSKQDPHLPEPCESKNSRANQNTNQSNQNRNLSQELVPGRAHNPRLKSHTKHQVHLRDEGRCTTILPNGDRCNESRWNEIHHIIPKGWGGSDDVANLTTLCSNHHKAMHDKKEVQFRTS